MATAGKHGVTANTAKNILFGAGTIHKNLVYTPGQSGAAGSWNFADSIIGATNGGSKVSIVPEYTDVPVDGALVAVKGLKVKTGETANMDINLVELSKETIKMATNGADGTSSDAAYDLIESKANIATGDYLTNIAFVGKTLDGRNVIAILENALCTNGFEQEGKNKEGAVLALSFASHADVTSDLDKLPWKIYYPKATA